MTSYVLCPGGIVGPGPQALHQLAEYGAQRGLGTKLYYYGEGGATPPAYRNYQVDITTELRDHADNVVVVPEVLPESFQVLQQSKRVMWWLSVDNFAAVNHNIARRDGSAFGRGPLDFVYAPDQRVLHVAQSEYARLHLLMNGVEAISLVSCPPPADCDRYLSYKATMKKDRVAVNTAAGGGFCRALIDATQDLINWIDTTDLDGAGLADAIGTSKIYADFGDHSGLPIQPMLAALAGSVIITGSRGAAANEVDLPIKRKYVLNEASPDALARAAVLIVKVLADSRAYASDFAAYRRWIERLPGTFDKQAQDLFDQV